MIVAVISSGLADILVIGTLSAAAAFLAGTWTEINLMMRSVGNLEQDRWNA